VPAVFFDTGAASFNIENNDDNAEVSALIAALKQVCPVPGWPALTLSVVLILHVAKSQRKEEAEEISSIGAQAWGADVNGTSVFWQDAMGERFLYSVKRRSFNPLIVQWRVSAIRRLKFLTSMRLRGELARAFIANKASMAWQRTATNGFSSTSTISASCWSS
jgi:hypothetical protein